MKSRIQKASTLVYSGKTIEVKKSMTQVLVSKYYQLSEESDHKSKLADAWSKYRTFELKTAFQAVERGLYA